MSQSLGTALITGASSGIGAVYAERLARRGHDLLLVARRGDRLEKLAADLRKQYGIQVENLVADLSQAADLERVALRLQSDASIQTLINNAGVGQHATLTGGSAVNDADLINLNVTAVTRLTLAALPRFTQQNRGTIINISSVLAVQALPTTSIYSGTKGYVMHFTRGLQAELAESKVRIQLVLPGATKTEIWDNAGELGSNIDPSAFMDVNDLVDSALAGLDQGELVTIPPIHDLGLWNAYDQASQALFGATMTGKPAPRYTPAIL